MLSLVGATTAFTAGPAIVPAAAQRAVSPEMAVVIGVAADSGCGKSTFLRLLTGELLALKAENLEREGGGPSMKAMVQALERAGEHEKAAMLRSVLPDE